MVFGCAEREHGPISVNAIGQGGQDLSSATDRNVQLGMRYRYRVYAVRPTPQGPRGTGVSNVETVTIPEGRGERR